MTARKSISAWAEEILARRGRPLPAFGAAHSNADAQAKYDRITDWLRVRWRAELEADAWPLFGQVGRNIEHSQQAQRLLGADK